MPHEQIGCLGLALGPMFYVAASVELRSASGQLLQQMALPLLPFISKAALQFQHSQAIQRQFLEQFPQQRRQLAEQLYTRQLEKEALQLAHAAALERMISLGGAHPEMHQPPSQTFAEPLKQQQQPPKRRLHVRRINGKAQTTDPQVTDSPRAATQQSPPDGLSTGTQETNTSPRLNWPGLNVNEVQEVHQAGPDGSGRTCRRTTAGATVGEDPAASGNTADVSGTSPPEADQEQLSNASVDAFGKPIQAPTAETSDEMRTITNNAQIGLGANPAALVHTPGAQWSNAPKRDLLATQAVGSMAVVADALSRVGQAMCKQQK